MELFKAAIDVKASPIAGTDDCELTVTVNDYYGMPSSYAVTVPKNLTVKGGYISKELCLEWNASTFLDSIGDNGLLGHRVFRSTFKTAPGPVSSDCDTAPLKYGLDPLVKAFLADIVRRLTDGWFSRCASEWGPIVEISKAVQTRNRLNQLVTTLLKSGFSQFSDFLCLFRYLFLQGECNTLSADELVLYVGNSLRNFLGRVGREEFLQNFERFYDAGNGAPECDWFHVPSCVGKDCKGESFNPTTQAGTAVAKEV